ncbi:MAG: hypothetical protein Q9187_009535, partial [Circinaria calcarea]
CAEDNEMLKEKFIHLTRCTHIQVEGWMSAGTVSVKGPFQHPTAIIIKLNSGDGAVRFFRGRKDLGDRQTDPGKKEEVIMTQSSIGNHTILQTCCGRRSSGRNETLIFDICYLETVEQREEETDLIFGSWTRFELALKQVCGLINEGRAAARTIHRIKQKGSAAQYYSQFNAVASKLTWNHEAKGSAYYEGLKDAVKDHRIDDVPETYKGLVEESIKIDNRLHERKIERGGMDWEL